MRGGAEVLLFPTALVALAALCLLWAYWLAQRSISGSGDLYGSGRVEVYPPRIVGAALAVLFAGFLLWNGIEIAREELREGRLTQERNAELQRRLECVKVLKATDKCGYEAKPTKR